VTPYSLVETYQHIGITYCVYPQAERLIWDFDVHGTMHCDIFL